MNATGQQRKRRSSPQNSKGGVLQSLSSKLCQQIALFGAALTWLSSYIDYLEFLHWAQVILIYWREALRFIWAPVFSLLEAVMDVHIDERLAELLSFSVFISLLAIRQPVASKIVNRKLNIYGVPVLSVLLGFTVWACVSTGFFVQLFDRGESRFDLVSFLLFQTTMTFALALVIFALWPSKHHFAKAHLNLTNRALAGLLSLGLVGATIGFNAMPDVLDGFRDRLGESELSNELQEPAFGSIPLLAYDPDCEAYAAIFAFVDTLEMPPETLAYIRRKEELSTAANFAERKHEMLQEQLEPFLAFRAMWQVLATPENRVAEALAYEAWRGDYYFSYPYLAALIAGEDQLPEPHYLSGKYRATNTTDIAIRQAILNVVPMAEVKRWLSTYKDTSTPVTFSPESMNISFEVWETSGVSIPQQHFLVREYDCFMLYRMEEPSCNFNYPESTIPSCADTDLDTESMDTSCAPTQTGLKVRQSIWRATGPQDGRTEPEYTHSYKSPSEIEFAYLSDNEKWLYYAPSRGYWSDIRKLGLTEVYGDIESDIRIPKINTEDVAKIDEELSLPQQVWQHKVELFRSKLEHARDLVVAGRTPEQMQEMTEEADHTAKTTRAALAAFVDPTSHNSIDMDAVLRQQQTALVNAKSWRTNSATKVNMACESARLEITALRAELSGISKGDWASIENVQGFASVFDVQPSIVNWRETLVVTANLELAIQELDDGYTTGQLSVPVDENDTPISSQGALSERLVQLQQMNADAMRQITREELAGQLETERRRVSSSSSSAYVRQNAPVILLCLIALCATAMWSMARGVGILARVLLYGVVFLVTVGVGVPLVEFFADKSQQFLEQQEPGGEQN